MKKLLLVLTITLLGMITIKPQEAEASEPDIVWNSINAFSTYYYLNYVII